MTYIHTKDGYIAGSNIATDEYTLLNENPFACFNGTPEDGMWFYLSNGVCFYIKTYIHTENNKIAATANTSPSGAMYKWDYFLTQPTTNAFIEQPLCFASLQASTNSHVIGGFHFSSTTSLYPEFISIFGTSAEAFIGNLTTIMIGKWKDNSQTYQDKTHTYYQLKDQYMLHAKSVTAFNNGISLLTLLSQSKITKLGDNYIELNGAFKLCWNKWTYDEVNFGGGQQTTSSNQTWGTLPFFYTQNKLSTAVNFTTVPSVLFSCNNQHYFPQSNYVKEQNTYGKLYFGGDANISIQKPTVYTLAFGI